MIPWNQFTHRRQDPDWIIELNEYNLFHYVSKGPTQGNRVLDSPMLEHAQEGQFAIAQLGLRHVQFEAEHTARIQSTLDICRHWFADHETNEDCRPTSPHCEELTDFRTSPHYLESLPSLRPSDLLEVRGRSPSPTITSGKSGRSPMSVEALITPEVVKTPGRKRKHSDDLSPAAITPDDSPEELDVLATPAFLRTSPNTSERVEPHLCRLPMPAFDEALGCGAQGPIEAMANLVVQRMGNPRLMGSCCYTSLEVIGLSHVKPGKWPMPPVNVDPHLSLLTNTPLHHVGPIPG